MIKFIKFLIILLIFNFNFLFSDNLFDIKKKLSIKQKTNKINIIKNNFFGILSNYPIKNIKITFPNNFSNKKKKLFFKYSHEYKEFINLKKILLLKKYTIISALYNLSTVNSYKEEKKRLYFYEKNTKYILLLLLLREEEYLIKKYNKLENEKKIIESKLFSKY